MRKFLLSAAALMVAMTMNAQEICVFNADNALGLDSDNGTALTAGTVIGETESIVAKVGADDTYKPQSATFTIGDQTITGGLQGATNPRDADGNVPNSSLNPTASGAFLVFEAKADGFLYVMHKASSNKAYTVFEEGTCISYTFAAIGSADTDLGAVYQFTLPYEVENEQFVVKNPIDWAEREFLKNTDPDKYAAHWTTQDDGTQKWTDIKVNGLGVIKFPVYKDCKYIVNACGSKITAAGYAFSPVDNLTIMSGDVTIIGAGAAAGEVWTVAGTKPLCDNSWDPSDTKCVMKTTDGVNYTYTKEDIVLEKGTTYEFKVVKGNAWGEEYPSQNFTFDVEETAKYKVTVKFNSDSKDIDVDVVKTGEAEAAEHIYSVIGTINGNWDADTDMTKGADGLYAAVFTDVKAGDYKFKVRVDHDWSVAYPGSDYALNVESDGSTVTITFNEATKEVKATVAAGTGIQVVKALTEVLNIYNLAGQRVDANYKGVVIINGQKKIQK